MSLPTRISSTGLRDRSRSQTVCNAPSNSRSCSTSHGTSSITAIDGRSAGIASARARSAWFQSAVGKPRTVSASVVPIRLAASMKSARSAAGFRPRVAWKTL
ncbi:hypothetical protein ACIA5E_19590 [Nocardia asteroides]|uniref:hypothetical protein n=1 Tax=Nocardia asteroides TaxID=1824 RepID=UPI00379AD45E